MVALTAEEGCSMDERTQRIVVIAVVIGVVFALVVGVLGGFG
jgi:hypothetical protein